MQLLLVCLQWSSSAWIAAVVVWGSCVDGTLDSYLQGAVHPKYATSH